MECGIHSSRYILCSIKISPFSYRQITSRKPRNSQRPISMASIITTTGLVLPGYTKSSGPGSSLGSTRATTFGTHRVAYSSGVDFGRRRKTVVRAEVQPLNPEIRKTEAKVVDSVVVTELAKPLTAYCRCWRSGTFPLCDGSHVKHNKATGDNVGPLLLKKE